MPHPYEFSPDAKRRWPWRLGLIGLAIGLGYLSGCGRSQPKIAPAKLPEVVVDYPVEEVVTDFQEFTGRTVAVYTVEIRARVSGYLDRVSFKDGTDVKAGDLLFEIDPRSYRAEVERADANIAQFRSRLERLVRVEERGKKLIAGHNISDEQFDQMVFDREETDASLKAAIAAKDLADLNLSFTRITSPITGQISRRMVDPGNLVKADETALTTVVSVDPIYAYFDMDERTLLQLRRLIQQGRIKSAHDSEVIADVALADEDNFTLRGTINFMDNQVEATTGTLRVRAVIANADELLSPGLFVRIRIPVGAPHRAVLVREEALGTDQGQRYVYVVDSANEVSYRRVKIGMLNGSRRVIEEGLKPGERVIVTGLQRVRPGIKVAPRAATASVAMVPTGDPKRLQPSADNHRPASGNPAK